MKASKIRLDILLFKKGIVDSREKAKALIMSGIVYIDNKMIDKAGTKVDKDSNILIKGDKLKYVSRGGLKLSKALEYFNIDVKRKTAIDIGASTGGFTDCLLQNGVSKVYAIDVGYGQLAWKLRNNSKVNVMERTNIRYVTKDAFDEEIDIITIDVSFISLTKVLPVAKDFLVDKGEIICLIKPQFEAGRESVGKKGVVKDPMTHIEVIRKLCGFFIKDLFLVVKGLTYSPIKGPEGNIEYLLYLSKNSANCKGIILEDLIKNTVEEAHIQL